MTPVRRLLARGFGLRARMTASYVLVTFAAVIVVEALAAVVVIPDANYQADLASRVVNTANQYTKEYTAELDNAVQQASGSTDLITSVLGQQLLGDASVHLRPGEVRTQGQVVLIPHVDGTLPDSAPMSLALILSPRGIVYASSYPDRWPVGAAVASRLPASWDQSWSQVSKRPGGLVAWASQAIPSPDAAPSFKLGKAAAARTPPLGYVYVQVPGSSATPISLSAVLPLVQTGGIFLLVSLPVGVLFGMLTTRGTVRRLRRLAAGTVSFAAGDFSQRVPASGPDEVGQLERHFNGMAERLSDSIAEQRALAERNARLAERSRISRELHDSISQDLFSISALVGGLRKALPAGSAVQPQLETLSSTVGSTIQEMRALLLELRPTALEEKGLVPALADLCEAYEARVGVRVNRELEAVPVGPAIEQAIFRIAQEGLSNAVRHSEADQIDLRLRLSGAEAELSVADNGRGFDREASAHGLGLRLMAERVRELGGSLAIDSGAGRGTRLLVLLPAGG